MGAFCMTNNNAAIKGFYETIGNHIYVFFSYPPNSTIKQILTMNYAYMKNVKGRVAWVLANNKQNLQLVQSLIPPLPKPNPLANLPHNSVSLSDVLVRIKNSSFLCKNHHLDQYAGEVPVLLRNGNLQYALIPIWYCHTCRCYFVLDQTFQNLKAKGVIACRIVDYPTFQNYHPNYITPNPISPLRLHGYCVNQQEDLSDNQRRAILELIIDRNILGKDKVLSYLSYFMNNPHAGQNALDKWYADYKYISGYKLDSAKRIIIKGFIRV